MTFAEAALSRDDFLGGQIKIWQPKQGYRAATDPVFLAASVTASAGQSVLELGCGAGVGLACLCKRVVGLDAHGLEIQPAYAGLARRNSADNELGFTVHDGDLLHMPDTLRQKTFDHVFANPPFYNPLASSAPSDTGRDTAHREGDAKLADWIYIGLKRLKPRGYITIIHRTERLTDILSALQGKAGGVRILPLTSRAGRDAGRVIVQARKGSAEQLRLLAPFIIHAQNMHAEDEGGYSTLARNILRNTQPLVL